MTDKVARKEKATAVTAEDFDEMLDSNDTSDFLDDRNQPKVQERDFDEMFDNGEDISDYLDLSRVVPAKRFMEEVKKSEQESD